MLAVQDAVRICEKAISEAHDKIDEMNDDDLKESREIIELLKENVVNWTKKQKVENTGEGKPETKEE
jgi:hypothetical protein